MKRDVISFDEEKCNGCGLCIPNCPEGAIQIINGKARLISDLFCDGLGACIGHCPQGAISIEKREAEPYDERRVMKNVVKAGPDVIAAHLKHLKDHNQEEYYQQAKEYLEENNIAYTEEPVNDHACNGGGCPGSRMMDFSAEHKPANEGSSVKLHSELRQWPVQLHLLNPSAPYFKNADLVVAADCVPFAFADFHRRFLKGKALAIFCPKLDHAQEQYVEKLAQIFTLNNIKSVSIVHMEVPCCFGVESIVQEALQKAGKTMVVKDYTLSLQGEIL